jgi:hypothetical protein
MIKQDGWRVRIEVSWCRIDPPQRTGCDLCHGCGSVGGGKFSFEDATECPRCYGRGYTTVHPGNPPDLPPRLIELLTQAYRQYKREIEP